MRVLGLALALLVVCLAACAAEPQDFDSADAATFDRGASVDRPAAVDAGTRFDVPTFDVPTLDVTTAADATASDAGAACTPVGEVPYASHTSREEFTTTATTVRSEQNIHWPKCSSGRATAA